MKREDLLKDEWVKENFGDVCYPNYLEPNFEAGVEYGERKAIEIICSWLNSFDPWKYMGNRYEFQMCDLIDDLRKAMEDEV